MDKRPLVAIGALALLASLAGVAHAGEASRTSFIDPTASITNRQNVEIGRLVYVAPYATLRTGRGERRGIEIGAEADLQDSVTVDSRRGRVELGEQAILAHGSTVNGPARVGVAGTCPGGAKTCPSFVSFNAEVDGAIIQKDAMVLGLARVGRGVRIPSGRRVLPGRSVDSQAEVETETVPVTEADREFMRGVLEVNTEFARGYSELADEEPRHVRGVGDDPGGSEFNRRRNLPTFAGVPTRDPRFGFRVIGDVQLADRRERLTKVSGKQISLRADEGEPFEVGHVKSLGSRTTFHALEHTGLELGDGGSYGYHSIVHGGPTEFDDRTITGANVTIGAWSVFFRSRIGAGSVIGARSLVQQSDLPAGTTVPPRTVMIENEVVGSVEW